MPNENTPEITIAQKFFIGTVKEEIKKLFFQAAMKEWRARFNVSVYQLSMDDGTVRDAKSIQATRQAISDQTYMAEMEAQAMQALRGEAEKVGMDLDSPMVWKTNFSVTENITGDLTIEEDKNEDEKGD